MRPTKLFNVRWEVTVEASNAEEAALKTVELMREHDPDRIDNCFDVAEVTNDEELTFARVDLDAIDDRV